MDVIIAVIETASNRVPTNFHLQAMVSIAMSSLISISLAISVSNESGNFALSKHITLPVQMM
jgi:hypothetical protein